MTIGAAFWADPEGRFPIQRGRPECLLLYSGMKNIQIIDGADTATFSLFQAREDEYAELFVDGADMDLVEDVIGRLGEDRAGEILGTIWERPILKRDANGLHGTLFYDWTARRHHLPLTKREVDLPDGSINEAQRRLFQSMR
ncbi:hypothetical protein [Brevundimonas sp.]|uniref:hypothetical protein n=1 Tax=Brevundimonas sp. TaxID=1871086 RepID=UPI00289C02FF|nr:hypothetical protein [Brevundimonas sp.]